MIVRAKNFLLLLKRNKNVQSDKIKIYAENMYR